MASILGQPPDSSSGDLQSGFSLLEILVAFSILSLSLGVILQIFGKGINLAATSSSYSQAVLVAESVMATVGVVEPLQEGENSGQTDGLYNWSVEIFPYELEDSEVELENLPFTVYQVQVNVIWENRSVSLKTLRIGPQT